MKGKALPLFATAVLTAVVFVSCGLLVVWLTYTLNAVTNETPKELDDTLGGLAIGLSVFGWLGLTWLCGDWFWKILMSIPNAEESEDEDIRTAAGV